MSALHTRENTHQVVLPQRPALELASADNPRVGTKRGAGAVPTQHTGMQHGRGETGTDSPVGTGATRPGAVNPALTVEGDLNAVPAVVVRAAAPVTIVMVAVLGRDGKPLMPTRPSRARQLLKAGRARVHQINPVFTIRLIDRTATDGTTVVDGVEVGIDPGSKHTGMAVFTTKTSATSERVVVRTGLAGFQVEHRGAQIHKNITSRAQLRRGRRSRNLRYRQPRFNNRCRPEGWLAPSLQHRVDSTMSMVSKLRAILPVTVLHQELVRFDMGKMTNPEVSGVEYQQGTLFGFEVREYLLAKFNWACVYCGVTGVPLNLDHVHAKSKGGSDRVSNLVLACIGCNKAKGNLPLEVFVPDPVRRVKILRWAKAPLRDAAAVNATRWSLWRALTATRLQVRTGSGGRTKFNRTRSALPKSHALDALAVGDVTYVHRYPTTVTVAFATGRGSYARTRSDKFGFPRLHLTRTKRHFGFATGDTVRAVVPAGKKAGTHLGRVAVRARGSFNIKTAAGVVQGVHHRHCTLLRRADGWHYMRNQDGTR